MKGPETIAGVRALLGDDALVTEREAAEILCVHVETLARLRRSGEIPHGRVGKRIVYSVGVLRRLCRKAAA